MTSTDDILAATEDLVVATGRLPSLAAVAARVGLTKQGVLHHFPGRDALDLALLRRALTRMDDAMRAAAAAGDCAPTYLRLAVPSAVDRVVAAVVMAGLGRDGAAREVMPEVAAAQRRWEDLMAAELGDPRRAEVVRLAADGLFAEAVATGTVPGQERVEALVAYLVLG